MTANVHSRNRSGDLGHVTRDAFTAFTVSLVLRVLLQRPRWSRLALRTVALETHRISRQAQVCIDAREMNPALMREFYGIDPAQWGYEPLPVE